jgi:hypothetical protein
MREGIGINRCVRECTDNIREEVSQEYWTTDPYIKCDQYGFLNYIVAFFICNYPFLFMKYRVYYGYGFSMYLSWVSWFQVLYCILAYCGTLCTISQVFTIKLYNLGLPWVCYRSCFATLYLEWVQMHTVLLGYMRMHSFYIQ